MSTWRPIGLLMILFLFASTACTNTKGTVAGRVAPSAAGVSVSAAQNGKTIVTVSANSDDGTFTLVLPPGSYDIQVSVPNGPFPLTLSSIVVASGKTTTLQPVFAFPPSAGHSVLSGKVTPAGAGAKISLYAEGKERASVNTDADGKYQFTELPAGAYSVRAAASGYAKDSVEVNLADQQSVSQDMRLLYVSSVDGVDWAAGKIRATGVGLTPVDAVNATIGREMARRAALADAQRKLVKLLSQLQVNSDQSLKSFWASRYEEKVQGFIRGYKVVGEHDLGGGRIEIELELPLTGQGGLSQYLGE